MKKNKPGNLQPFVWFVGGLVIISYLIIFSIETGCAIVSHSFNGDAGQTGTTIHGNRSTYARTL